MAVMTAMAQDRAMSPFGYCGTSVTGGGNAIPTLVSTLDEFKAATAKGTTPRVVIITHDIEFNSLYTIQDTQNLTILALPGVKLFSNEQNKEYSGILYFKRCSNIILRNITFVGPGAYDCDGNDCLCFQDVTYSWVDHCDFQDGCDGNFDNKNGTDNVTVSWCRFRYLKDPKAGGSGGSNDHRYTNLLGSSSTDKPDDGTYNMTWAYCWWDEGCKERMLRCRNASLHFLGCYWNSSVASYYIGPENADAYVELCTFEGNPNTSRIFYQNYGGTNGVTFVNSVATKGLPANISNRPVLVPSYSAPKYSSATEAKEAVTEYAGATLQVDEQGNVSGTNIAANTPVINKNLESSATAYVGIEKTLSITASYADSYQWYRNTTASNSGGTAISGATSSSYTFTPSAVGTYYYYCVATNSQATGTKSVASAVCTVTVNAAPTMWTAATATYNSTSKGYEVAGVGTYYKSTSGGTTTINEDAKADWIAGNKNIRTGSSLFIFSPAIAVTGLKLYVMDSSNRVLSSTECSSTLNGTYSAQGSTADKNVSGYTDVTITFNSTIAANQFIKVTFNGNVNVYGIEPITSQVPSTPQPTSVIVSPANKTLEVGETLELSAQVLPTYADQSLAWSSDKPSVAEVDEDGVVTARAIGTVKITATTANEVSDYCVLNVVEKQSGGSGETFSLRFGSQDVGSITSSKQYCDKFTIVGTPDKSVAIDGSSKTIDDVSFTHCAKLGGSGSSTYRYISFAVSGPCKIKVYGATSSSGNSRSLAISSGATPIGSSLKTGFCTSSSTPVAETYEYEGGATNIYIYSTNSGYNVYGIDVTPINEYITKHISSTGWASFVPEKSVKVPDNVKVYYVKSNSYNSTKKTVTAVKIPAGTVIKGDGNTGYIVNAETEGDYQFEVSSDEAQMFDENMLACGENKPILPGSLVFACYNGTSGFYALDNYAINLPVGIVYLPASVFTGTGAPRAVTINFDEATVINNSITEQFNNSFFNINGQKVDANYRGIIIRNGRKYINK